LVEELNRRRSRLAGIGMTSERTRQRMVQRLQQAGINDMRVLAALARIPRHLFLDEALASRAYEDTALPIGHRQTISRPFAVARMTAALLEAGVCSRVLEIGTGCGYQTAVLSALVEQVFTIERIAPLLNRATAVLCDLGIGNVRLRHGDGHEGWRDQAPFDGILVAAGGGEIPAALRDQLAVGGRMLIPVGDEEVQVLLRLTRNSETEFVEERLDAVRFVPLKPGKH
jgi:protein-L-isoaspartate(D-aspartate) O-methyltransferase